MGRIFQIGSRARFLPDRAWRSSPRSRATIITPFPRNDVRRINGQDGAVSIVNSVA
jgi:hypothetical protein